jgi:DNA polymerase III epsilon subunit-like protein
MMRHRNPRHREEVSRWAQDLMNRGNFYVLDTETTGVGKGDEIVQIGIVDKQGNIVMNQLIKPVISIPNGASAVHGIYDSDVEDAPTFKEIYVDLSKMLAGQIMIAYNMDFDWRMLQQSSAKYRLPDIRTGKRDCAMKQYAKFNGKWNSKRRSYVWHKLGNAIDQEGLMVENAHDAVGDVLMTLALIKKMAESV